MAHENETTAAPAARPPGPIEDLQRRLELDRGMRTLKRGDALQRLQERVRHQLAVSAARAEARRDRRARREENRDAGEATNLADLRRRATVSGERARVRSQIMQSAEMRALRVERVRRGALYVLIPVLLAFAAWSTTSVHSGFVRILGIADGSPMWYAAWGVEPALITIVAGIIIVRAILRSAGGDLDWRATFAEWAALSSSIALAAAGHWSGWSLGALVVVGVACVGPLGAALTAWLIGLVDDAVSRATPEKDAPRLADMSLSRRVSATEAPHAESDTPALESRVEEPVASPAEERVASDTSQVSAPVVSMSDRSERDLQVIAWLVSDPDMSGAEIGRRVGATARTGQRLKDRLAPVAATQGDTGQAVASDR